MFAAAVSFTVFPTSSLPGAVSGSPSECVTPGFGNGLPKAARLMAPPALPGGTCCCQTRLIRLVLIMSLGGSLDGASP